MLAEATTANKDYVAAPIVGVTGCVQKHDRLGQKMRGDGHPGVGCVCQLISAPSRGYRAGSPGP